MDEIGRLEGTLVEGGLLNLEKYGVTLVQEELQDYAHAINTGSQILRLLTENLPPSVARALLMAYAEHLDARLELAHKLPRGSEQEELNFEHNKRISEALLALLREKYEEIRVMTELGIDVSDVFNGSGNHA